MNQQLYEFAVQSAYQRSRQAREDFENTVQWAREKGLTSGRIARCIGWTEAGVRKLAQRRGWDEAQDQAPGAV